MKIETLIDDGSWEVAKNVCAGLGNFNNLLTQVTKILERLGPTSAEGKPTSYFLMRSLLSSHQIRAKFLYAMSTIYPEESDSGGFTSIRLYSKFKQGEISVISAGIFCYHLLKKVTPSEFLPELEKDIQEYDEVGMLCGHVLPKVGLEKGLLLGLLRPVAFAALCKKNPKGYAQYRSALKKAKLGSDLTMEMEIFKCQHPQVISLIAQKLGFSRRLSQDLYLAFATSIVTPVGDPALLRKVILLIDSIMSGDGLPVVGGSIDYAMLGVERESLVSLLKPAMRVKDIGSLHAWMSKGERDITAANSPDLFNPVEESPHDDDFDFRSIPEAVRQEFSFEDFSSFRSAIKDIIGED